MVGLGAVEAFSEGFEADFPGALAAVLLAPALFCCRACFTESFCSVMAYPGLHSPTDGCIPVGHIGSVSGGGHNYQEVRNESYPIDTAKQTQKLPPPGRRRCLGAPGALLL